jgi:hypothetical protein
MVDWLRLRSVAVREGSSRRRVASSLSVVVLDLMMSKLDLVLRSA